jgi:general secretion pathway protein D
MPTSNLIGQVRFIPVARSKAILVLAPPEYLDDINKMVTELDQPGMQVMIKVVIAEVNHSSMTSLGVQLTTDSSMVNAFTDNAANILSGFVYNGNIGSTVLDMTANLNTLISLLVKKTNAKILNQPTLWTKDNEEAVFIKGQRVAFIQGDQDSANGITRSFSYDDVGLTLRLRPNITPEKAVDMTINLIISQVEPERINDQVAVSNLDTTTHLIVNDGQTIMLGGILFQNESNVKRKVPLLGDVPIMGELFKHSEKQLSNDELLCFVTPYVIDSDNLNAIPADKDTKKQLEEPLKKMQEIRGNLDKAMEWLSSEVKEENYDVKKDDKSGEVEIAVPDAASSDKTVVVPAP